MNCNICIHKPICKDVNQANIYTKPVTCKYYLDTKNCIIAPFDITTHLHNELNEVVFDAAIEAMKGNTYFRAMIPLQPFDETEE